MRLDESTEDTEVHLELAPLIDVLFLLVLFFAVSTSLISPEDLGRLKERLSGLTVSHAELSGRTEAQTAHIGRLEADLGSRDTTLARQTGQIGMQAAHIRRIEGDLLAQGAVLADQSGQLAVQAGRVGQLERDLAARTTALARQTEQAGAQAARLERLERDLTAQATVAAERARAADEQVLRVIVLDGELGTARAQAAAQMEAAQRLAGEKRAADEALARERAGRQDEAAALSAELERLRQQLLQLGTENRRYQEAFAADEKRLAGVAETQRRLRSNLDPLIADKTLGVEQVDDRLVLQLSDKILFPAGNDQLKPEGLTVLASVAEVLKQRVKGLPIQIGGHTDTVPVSGGRFVDNWQLSAARAINVVRFFETQGLDPTRLSAVGYGAHQPIAGNDTPEGRSANRRIEIVLLAK